MHQIDPVLSAPPRISMCVLGDSLAHGLGASGEEHGLAQRLFRHVRSMRPESTYANHAVPHSTMGDVLRHQVPKLHRTQSDLVVLIAGANDLRYSRDVLVFARRFKHLLGAVHDAAPQACIVVGGMPDVTQTIGVPAMLKPAISRVCARMNELMRKTVSEFDDHFIDLYEFTARPLRTGVPYLCDDGFHPNDDGYAEIAERALPAFAAALARF